MPSFIKIAEAADIAPGQCRVVELGSRSVALYNVGGTFHATDNSCLHQGGPLGEGDLDGTRVVCPWHGWSFDVVTGVCEMDPDQKIDCYPLKVEGGSIYVEL